MQCSGTTTRGTQCTRKVAANNTYCYQHVGQAVNELCTALQTVQLHIPAESKVFDPIPYLRAIEVGIDTADTGTLDRAQATYDELYIQNPVYAETWRSTLYDYCNYILEGDTDDAQDYIITQLLTQLRYK